MRQNIFCVQPRLIAVYAAGCWLLYSGVEIGGQTGSDNSASTRLPQQRQVSRRDIE